MSTPQVELDHQVLPEPDGSLNFNFDFEAGRFPAGLPGKLVHAYVSERSERKRGSATCPCTLLLQTCHPP